MNPQWTALKDAFARAHSLDADARARFLADLKLAQPTLAGDLRVLLDDGDRLGAFMDAPLGQWLSSAEAEETSEPAALPAPGDDVGAYRIERLLGRGGMGAVFLAHQNRPVQRPVALKVMHGRTRTWARFFQEQQILARMEHPHIARYYDAGTTEAGAPYLVMEYVDGPRLTRWCEGRDIRRRLTLFLDVCDAVAYSHENGVVHRDLKPANILVAHRGGKDVVKVIDFGIAKDGAAQQGHTRTGQFLGTPDYMSPEQAGLVGVPVGPATDGYALGVLLYQLLCDCLPFDFAERPLLEMCAVLKDTRPAPPSTRTSAPLPAGLLWRDLDAVVLKALEKDPGFRYEGVGEMAADLRRALEGRVVRAARLDPVYHLRKIWGRYHRLAPVLGIALLVLAGLIGWGSWERLQTRHVTEFWTAYRVLEGDLEAAYLLPLHDISPQRDRLRAYIGELETRVPSFRGPTRTEAHHLLGRAYMTLDAWEEASAHLNLAARRDPSNADVAAQAAYCRALAVVDLHQQARDIKEPELRAVALARVRRDHVQPALADLERARRLQPAPRAYLEAGYAFLKDDHEAALGRLAEAIRRDPFAYRYHALAGRIHQARAAALYLAGDADGYLAACTAADSAFAQCMTIARSNPAAYEEQARHLLGLKKRARGRDWVDEPTLVGRAEYLAGQGLRADPGRASLLGLLVQVQMEEALDFYEMGHRARDILDPVSAQARYTLVVDPCDPDALLSVGQMAAYYTRLEYPALTAVHELAAGIEALETLQVQQPRAWAGARGLTQLYSFMVIAASPHRLPTQPWMAKSLALTREMARLFPDTAAYHRARGTALQSYAMQMTDVGADAGEVTDLSLHHLHRVAAAGLEGMDIYGSIAEMYRVRAQADLMYGRDPSTAVALAMVYVDAGIDEPDLDALLFSGGNALTALAEYLGTHGGAADDAAWHALGLYEQGIAGFPEVHRLYYGAAGVCMDQAVRARDAGRAADRDTWLARAEAYLTRGEALSPEYAGYPYLRSREAELLGCEEAFIDQMEQALVGNPHCFGAFARTDLYRRYAHRPGMQRLAAAYPDQSAAWTYQPGM